jgi:hypothetical protein
MEDAPKENKLDLEINQLELYKCNATTDLGKLYEARVTTY